MIKEENKKKIQEIIGEMHCPKYFRCAESGFENLCKAKDCGLENYLVCLEGSPLDCKFAVPFGHSYYCNCPLRVYLVKNLKK